ncbi:diguanylate cyclase [Marinobacter nauticus]
MLLSVGILILRKGNRYCVAIAATVALCALLIGLFKLGVYGYWNQDSSNRILLLSLPPQTAALQSLLAISLLIFCAHLAPKPARGMPILVLGSYGFMALICVLGWVYFSYLDSKAVQQQATDQAANVSRVLEEHVYRSLDPIDLVFEDLGRRVANDGLDSVTQSEPEWRRLRAIAESLPQVSSILMLDAEGEFRMFSRTFPAPDGNYSFREYFQAHENGEDLYLGELLAAGTSGKLIFTYSHRLTDAAGNFEGVILASMEIGYFRSFYRSLDLGPGAAVGLFRHDGKLMMREPLLPNIAGQHLDKHPIYTTLIPQSPTGTFVGYSPYDGEQKLAYYLASDDLPFVINTVLGMDSVVMPFEQRFLQSTAILLLLFSLLMMTMLTQLRVIERTNRAHQRVRQSQRFVQSVLDSVSAAIAIVSPSGEIVSVNAAWRRFGRENGMTRIENGVGQNYLQIWQSGQGEHPEGADSVLEELSAVIAGQRHEFQHMYPCPGPEGERWYRMKVIPMNDDSGQVVVSHESITELKQAEAELRTVANTDQLTGLDNRRAIIEKAESLLANAHRHKHPLSLMMIDCDHFKQVNDSYGHAGGDEVLRSLAQLMRQTCRTGDLVGRLGGEEFVAILPFAEVDGAVAQAERLRQAAQDTQVMCSEGSINFTISIGVATLQPGMDFNDLLKEADEALYQAKENGRNQVVAALSG